MTPDEKRQKLEDYFAKCATNASIQAQSSQEITLDNLKAMADKLIDVEVSMLASRFVDLPGQGYVEIPNPADVHPSTYAQIQRMLNPMMKTRSCGITEFVTHESLVAASLTGMAFHQRTDVVPGYLHRCKCKETK